MPKCTNGHESTLSTKCAVCGAGVSFKDALAWLVNLPKVTPNFGKVSTLYVGFPLTEVEGGGYSASLLVGEGEGQSTDAFTVTRIQGGNWSDYAKHSSRLARWLKAVGYDKSLYSLIVVNTTDPLAVLALTAFPAVSNAVVFAVSADQTSTPFEQNTSYVAIRTAVQKGFPVILGSSKYVEEAMFFSETLGFATRSQAVARLLAFFFAGIDDIMDFMGKDVRLGIQLHCFSAVVAGSNAVYRRIGDALAAQRFQLSFNVREEDLQTVYLAAFAREEARDDVERSFGQFRTQNLRQAISAGHRLYDRSGNPTLFDLVLLYGLKEDEVYRQLRGGYEKVRERVPQLRFDNLP